MLDEQICHVFGGRSRLAWDQSDDFQIAIRDGEDAIIFSRLWKTTDKIHGYGFTTLPWCLQWN